MSGNKKKKDKTDKKKVQAVPQSPIQVTADNTLFLKILAKPGANQNSVTDISNEGIGIKIAAAPVDGEANSELIKFISKLFGIRKSDINLDKGSKSRSKILKISGGITKETILEKLQEEIKNS